MTKALIVDDCDITRPILEKLLNGWGIESVQATNGKEALELLEKTNSISIALVDWFMPEMSGIELVRRLRQDDRFVSVKILMVTTANDMPDIKTALEAGVDEYIMKPITKEILHDKLAMLGMRNLVG